MNIEQIETFLSLVETRNFNRTAERMNITQSTVSARIKALENSLGATLFERGRSGAEPTAAGSKFLTFARNLKTTWNLARQELALPDHYSGRLRFATQVSLWEKLVNRWILWMQDTFPNIAIHVEADYSSSMVDDILFGSLDVGVVYAPRYLPELTIKHLFDEEFVMIAAEPLSIEDITVDNYVFIGWSDHFKSQHSQLLPELQTTPLSMGLGSMSFEYLCSKGGAVYSPVQTADNLIARGDFHLVRNAPRIVQPVYTVHLSKMRNNALVLKAISGLKSIVQRDEIPL